MKLLIHSQTSMAEVCEWISNLIPCFMMDVITHTWWEKMCVKGAPGVSQITQQMQNVWIFPDSKVHGANMGPTWVLSAPDGSHVGPMNLAIRVFTYYVFITNGLEWERPLTATYPSWQCARQALGCVDPTLSPLVGTQSHQSGPMSCLQQGINNHNLLKASGRDTTNSPGNMTPLQ